MKEIKTRKLLSLLLSFGLFLQAGLPAGAQEAEIIVEGPVIEGTYFSVSGNETGDVIVEPIETATNMEMKPNVQNETESMGEETKETVLDISGKMPDIGGENAAETKETAETAGEVPIEIAWEIVGEDQEDETENELAQPADKNYEISSDGCSAFRVETTDSDIREYYAYVNPDIDKKLDNEDFAFLQNPELVFSEGTASIADGDYKQFTSIEQAGAEMRQKMKERIGIFEIGFRMEQGDYDQDLHQDIFREAVRHTGVPTEGDYLRQAWSRAYVNIQSTVNNGIWTGTIQCKMKYFTTAEQEAAMDDKIAEVMNSKLDLAGKSEYEKIKSIYDYICFHVYYDYDEEKEKFLNHSAYAALVKGKAVCNGYAQLFYRMALEAGLHARYVGGIASQGASIKHAWNIVEIDGRYYNLDATWDAVNPETPESQDYELFLKNGHSWFLKCPQTFTSHYREDEYATEHFSHQYPMADRDYEAGVPGTWPESGTCGEQLTWTLDEQGVLTVQGTGNMTDYSNEKLSPWKAQDVRKVVLGEGITGIGANAFCYCTNMTEAVLPQSLKNIGDSAFSECTSLKGIVFPKSLKRIGTNAFYKCSALTELSLPGTLESVGIRAFGDVIELRKVTMENGVKGLGEFVFQGCVNLNTVSFPLSVVDVNSNIFTDCLNLANMTITGTGPIGAYAADKKAPWNRASLENVVIGDGITEIGDYAFYSMSGLQSVFIPGAVTVIGASAFSSCSRLKQVVISPGVTKLGKNCFYNCDGLTEVTIPGTVKTVGEQAFMNCKSLKTVTICDGVGSLLKFAFYGCDKLQNVLIPANILVLEGGIFSECPLLTQITITGKGKMPDYTGKIRAWAVSSVEKVTLQKGITKIGACAFYNMDGLKTVEFSENITEIGREAFAFSDGLTEIKLPDKISKISENLFYACKGLRSIVIPSKVTRIEKMAFQNCTSLTEITIPGNVKSVGEQAFCGSGLKKLTIAKGVGELGPNSFYGCSSLTEVTIPGTVKTVGVQAFINCKSLKTVTICEGVQTLSKCAFYGCDKLQNVSVPASVKTIEGGVFQDCEKLKLSVIYGSAAEKYAKDNNIPFSSNACGAPEMKTAKNEKAGIKISWNKVSGADGYRVFRKSGSSWKKTADVKGGNTVTYTDKTVKSGTKYFYKVRALKNGKIAGDQSINSVSSIYLSVPTLKNVSGKAGMKAVVKWKKAGKGDGYEIRFRRGKTTKKVKVKNAGTVQQTVKLQQAGTYEVSIRSYKKSGGTTWYSVWSGVKKVRVKK